MEFHAALKGSKMKLPRITVEAPSKIKSESIEIADKLADEVMKKAFERKKMELGK